MENGALKRQKSEICELHNCMRPKIVIIIIQRHTNWLTDSICKLRLPNDWEMKRNNRITRNAKCKEQDKKQKLQN